MSEIVAALDELEQLERIRSEPVWFAESVLGLVGDRYYLDAWSKEFLNAVGDVYRKHVGIPTRINHEGKNMFTVRAMHGPGKTFTVAILMHWFNCAFRGRVICTAPTEKQLKTRLWPAFRKISARAGKDYSGPIQVDSTKITWHGDEDWCALAETASQPENLAGYHDDYMLFLVDEASGVSEQMFPVVEAAMSSGTIVILILIGNPTKNHGTFHASHCIAKVAKNYFQIHVDLDKTTRVSADWVRKMVEKYGRESPVVKIRCYGEFADADEAQLISYAWLVSALGREGVGAGNMKRLRVTVDVADGGENFTVITVGHVCDDDSVVVLKQVQRSFPSSESPILAADAAEQLFNAFGGKAENGDDFVVDSLGVGAGTAGELMKRGHNVVTYKGGEASDDVKQWRNRRAQSYISCRDAHRDGHIAYAEDFLDEGQGDGDWDEFTAQMCSIRTKPGLTEKRVEELETKEAMIKRGAVSPDRADGVAMFYATQAPKVPVMLIAAAVGQSQAAQENWE